MGLPRDATRFARAEPDHPVKHTAADVDGVFDLLDRIGLAEDLHDALTVLIDAVLVSRGVRRAVAMVVQGAELRGIAGVGWSRGAIRGLAVPLQDAEHPLVQTLRTGTILRNGNGQGVLDLQRYAALPIPSTSDDQLGIGLIVLDPAGHEATLDPMAEWVRHAAPSLGRIAEVESLNRSARQLESQRDLLRATVNALPDPVLITGADRGVILENRRAEALFSASATDSEKRRRAVEINNLLFSSFLTRTGGADADPAARELNLVDPRDSGDLLFEVLSSPLPPPLGPDGGMVSVLRDVTDLKRATVELEHQFKRVRQAELKSRRERDRLDLILKNVADPILVTDDQATIVLMNREAERLFQRSPGNDAEPQRRRDVQTNDTRFSAFVSEFALSGDAARISEIALRDPETGREFPAEVVSGKILNERAELTAIVSVLHDLTKAVENERLATELTQLNEGLEGRVRTATLELEERNQQLEWQSRELERAYRLKSQFLASMSHELRTPINALLGYTSLLQDRIYGDLTERQEESLSRMATASQHLLELVNDILDLAKIEAGKMPVHIEPVYIEQLVRELSLTIEPILREKALVYEVHIEPDLPTLETDRTKVNQVLLNLLSNAAKFTHEGQIRVDVRGSEMGGVEIAVSDSGIGIAETDLPKIFEDFRQVDQSSTREYGGTGLGLSITKKLLHLLGGTIQVDSCLGEGSTFTVQLPRRSEELVSDEQIAETVRTADEAVTRTTSDSDC